jgi:hypothetical protein
VLATTTAAAHGRRQAALADGSLQGCPEPADPWRKSVRDLWRCRGGEEGPGIAGIQESHDGQRLTGVVHAQFKRPRGMGLELKL